MSEAEREVLAAAQRQYDEVVKLVATFRAVVVEMIDKSSYREVARLTGLSTNTLQRWKREAGK